MAVALLALGLLVVPRAAAPATKVVVAQTSNSLGWAANYVAKAEKMFEREGLEVELSIVHGDAQSIPAAMSGDAPFAAATSLATLVAISKGADLAMVAPFTDQFVVEWVMNRATATRLGITPGMSLEDKIHRIKGLKVGVLDVGGSLHLLLNGLAKKYGLDANRDFTVTGIGPYSAMLAALKRGDLDLAGTAIPFGDEAVKAGYATMYINFWTGEVPAYSGAVHEALFVNRKWAAQHGDAVEAMRRAIGRALTFIHREPDRAVAGLRALFPTIPEDIVRTIVVQGAAGYPTTATISRKGFAIVRDFTAESINPAVGKLAYETVVWKSAQEPR